MTIPIEAAGLLAVHLALFLACLGYARLLNTKEVYEWYHPKRTWWTVAIGEALVGIAFGFACIVAAPWLRLEPMVAPILFFTLQLAGCIPIVRWQRQLERDLEAVEQQTKGL